MKHYCFYLLLFVMTLTVASLAQSDDVSVADVARKHRTHGKSVMVFNDDNTQRTAFTDDSAMADGDSKLPRSSATASGKAEPTKTGTGKTSAAPAGAQVDKLKKQLESLKQQQSVWSNSAKNYEEKLANETSDFRRQVDEEAMQNDKQNVQSYQQKINQVETELSKAQEPSHPAGHDQADNGSSGGHASQP